MATKRVSSKRSDEMRSEYDFSSLKNPVRGKYFVRAMAGSNVILLDPDIAEAFPNAKAVNDALRVLVSVARAKVRAGKRTRRRPA
jgi:hypothetical protein